MDQDADPRTEFLVMLRDQVDDEAVDRLDLGFLESARTVVQLGREWWGPGQPIAVSRAVELKFRMIYPLALHALNNVAVSLDLSERLPWVAAGQARIAFQHPLKAQWVLLTHDGEQELWSRSSAKHTSARRSSMRVSALPRIR